MLEKNDIFLIFNKCKDFEEMSLLFSLNIGRFFKKKWCDVFLLDVCNRFRLYILEWCDSSFII